MSTKLEQIRAVLQDSRGQWRELNSCADAIQDISMILDSKAPEAPRAARVVYLAHEDEDDSDEFPSIVLGVFRTKGAALKAISRRRREIRADGRADKLRDGDVTFEIERHEVR
jgi:hypothetical protein